jgi:hypothetical protein
VRLWTAAPPFTKGRNYPSLIKRGEGRFSEEYVCLVMDSLVSDIGDSSLILHFWVKFFTSPSVKSRGALLITIEQYGTKT